MFWVILASCCCLVYVGCLGVYAVCRRRWTAGEALVILARFTPFGVDWAWSLVHFTQIGSGVGLFGLKLLAGGQ